MHSQHYRCTVCTTCTILCGVAKDHRITGGTKRQEVVIKMRTHTHTHIHTHIIMHAHSHTSTLVSTHTHLRSKRRSEEYLLLAGEGTVPPCVMDTVQSQTDNFIMIHMPSACIHTLTHLLL